MAKKKEIKGSNGVHYKKGFGEKFMMFVIYFVYSILAFVCFYPFYYILINSISNNDLSARGKVLIVPLEIHFNNFVQVTRINGLLNAAFISVGRTVIGASLTVVAAAFLGFMFTRETMWGRKVWYRLVVATMYFNAGVIPWYLTMRNLGLTNNFWGYIFPLIVQPFNVVLCKTFVESTPKALQEAAEIDGAGTLTVFFKVILPIIKPILATIAVFAAVGQWNAFQDTLLLVTKGELYTLQYVLYQYITQANSLKAIINSQMSTESIAASLAHSATQTSVRMTVTIIVVFPIMCVYPFFQRYFTSGIMIGAVKG